MDDIVVLIPTYKPDTKIMYDFIVDLRNTFKNVLIVDDGCGKEFEEFFATLRKLDVKIVTHEVNKGKGRAIKTGFSYILENFEGITGVITADCDGQHCVEDIKKCAEVLRENPKSLIIGCRDFKEKHVPPRSRFGNQLTRLIFMIFIGITITDTQTGLRGFSLELMKKFINTVGERYEYETNMLIECKTSGIKLKEVPIKTIYINNNATSHFNPIKDSFMIYKLFCKYILSAISSFIVDIVLFSILVNVIHIENNIMISTIIARIISSIYNFIVNMKLVFKKNSNNALIKYFVLVIVQMLVSGEVVTLIAKNLNMNATIVKILVDTVIFVVNFVVQREWIFKNKTKEGV